MADTHDSHNKPPVPWMLIAVLIYAVTFFALLAAAIFIGGPITSGLLVWFAIVVIHSYIYVCVNRKSKEH